MQDVSNLNKWKLARTSCSGPWNDSMRRWTYHSNRCSSWQKNEGLMFIRHSKTCHRTCLPMIIKCFSNKGPTLHLLILSQIWWEAHQHRQLLQIKIQIKSSHRHNSNEVGHRLWPSSKTSTLQTMCRSQCVTRASSLPMRALTREISRMRWSTPTLEIYKSSVLEVNLASYLAPVRPKKQKSATLILQIKSELIIQFIF